MDQQQDRAHRAVAYLRIASTKDDSADAIAAQRAACRRIAEKYRATIVREYVDVGKPARLRQQDDLQRLLHDLNELRDVAYVVVWDYARLGRDLQSLDDVIQRIQACGAEIATITGVETVDRLASASLLDPVAEPANRPADNGHAEAAPEGLTTRPDLSTAIQKIRNGQLDTDQREALAALVNIAGNTTLPTPVAAAVLNAVETCKRDAHVKDQPTSKTERRQTS